MLRNFLRKLVLVHLPLKQGLRQGEYPLNHDGFVNVLVHLPLKQGLRRKQTSCFITLILRTSASSIKTRIKTFRDLDPAFLEFSKY